MIHHCDSTRWFPLPPISLLIGSTPLLWLIVCNNKPLKCLSLPVSVCLSLSVCLPACLAVCLPACLSACLPACLSVYISLSVCLSLFYIAFSVHGNLFSCLFFSFSFFIRSKRNSKSFGQRSFSFIASSVYKSVHASPRNLSLSTPSPGPYLSEFGKTSLFRQAFHKPTKTISASMDYIYACLSVYNHVREWCVLAHRAFVLKTICTAQEPSIIIIKCFVSCVFSLGILSPSYPPLSVSACLF